MAKSKQNPLPASCPVCGGDYEIARINCNDCETTIESHFTRGSFTNLNPQQWSFIETFVRCKGKIKDVEVALDISYPTVVARLNEVVAALGGDPGSDDSSRSPVSNDERRREVLTRLNKGELSAKDALRLLEGNE